MEHVERTLPEKVREWMLWEVFWIITGYSST